jgi:hypothetical protein
MIKKDLYDELVSSIQNLEDYSKKFDHTCAKNAVVVLKDQRVQEAFLKHIIQDEDFVGLSCHGFGIDSIEIVFRFQCRAPRICIIAPAFAVRYDPMTSTIIEILDPFVGQNLLPIAG